MLGLKIIIQEIAFAFQNFQGFGFFSREEKNNLFQAAADEAESNGQEDENGGGKSGVQDAEQTSAGVSESSGKAW